MRSPPYFWRMRRSNVLQPSTNPASNMTADTPDRYVHDVCPGLSGGRRNTVSRTGAGAADGAALAGCVTMAETLVDGMPLADGCGVPPVPGLADERAGAARA